MGRWIKRRGHRHALAHAFRIFRDQLLRHVAELEQIQQLIGAGARHGAIQTIDPADEFDELAAGKMIEQHGFIRHQADLLFDVERPLGHRQSQQLNAAGSGRRQAHQHFDGGGFAGAVRSQESEEATLGNGEREAVDGGLVAVYFSQIADFDRRRSVALIHTFSMVLARRARDRSLLRWLYGRGWILNSTGPNLSCRQPKVGHRTVYAIPVPKKRFIGPISKSLLKKRKKAGILFVSLAKNKWISSPNGDPNGNPAWLSRSTF